MGPSFRRTYAKRPVLLNKCAGPHKFIEVDKRSDHIWQDKTGLSQRLADVCGAQKSPPGN
jgi:hypothetical protein